jgi:hypothetical protein
MQGAMGAEKLCYLKLVARWCRTMDASSLVRSSPGNSLCPWPKEVKVPPPPPPCLPCLAVTGGELRERLFIKLM